MDEMQMKKQLKLLFRGYRNLTPSLKSELEDLGFLLKRQNKHIVLTYMVGDRQLCFSIPKTSSDWRMGLNFASEVFNAIRLAA